MAFERQDPFGRPRCDTYFVEDQDFRLPRMTARERANFIAKERQINMGEVLSRLTAEEYQDDILDHMELMENETLPDVASIDIQTEIQWFMRPYLLDFLIEAHAAFQLLPETLHLAINLLDRYCSKRVVYKRHYQLVGCASLQIAAKYGDRKDRVPTIRELKNMCCSLYDAEMFVQMEWHVLATLNWAVGHPTIDSFLQMALTDAPYDPEVEHMTWFLCEIAMFHKEFVSVQPSIMARSALALARAILGRSDVYQSNWAAKADSMVMVSLSQRLQGPSPVVSRKYASSHLSCVSTTLEDFLDRYAAIARQNAPPTPPCEVTMVEDKPYYQSMEAPHTPQKGQNQHLIQGGMPTPPITPENEYFVGDNQVKGNDVMIPQYPATPTPDPINQTQQCGYPYESHYPTIVD